MGCRLRNTYSSFSWAAWAERNNKYILYAGVLKSTVHTVLLLERKLHRSQPLSTKRALLFAKKSRTRLYSSGASFTMLT
jgi:hypothetical protein